MKSIISSSRYDERADGRFHLLSLFLCAAALGIFCVTSETLLFVATFGLSSAGLFGWFFVDIISYVKRMKQLKAEEDAYMRFKRSLDGVVEHASQYNHLAVIGIRREDVKPYIPLKKAQQ